ncbi:MAG: sensor histidine kinase [Eubacteriales bacterium]
MNTLRYKFVRNKILVTVITIALLLTVAVLSILSLKIEGTGENVPEFLKRALPMENYDSGGQIADIYGGVFLVCIISMGISTILSFFLLRTVIKSLNEINKASKNILQGKFDFEIMLPDEKELLEVAQNLESLRIKLKKNEDEEKRLENDRNMIMASLSHDLKTPITSIKGYLEGINDGLAKDEETLRRYLDIISSKSKLLEQLAENMSDYSELELGRMHFNFKYLDLSELLDSFCKLWRLEMGEQKRVLIENITEKELLIVGDELKLKRVFDNLVMNAIKYSKEESEILVSLEEAEHGAILIVSDNGKGIKSEDLRNIFDGFYRGDAARSNVSGNGLGLAIAKQIVEKHRGKIWIRSEQNVGTQVYIYLPIRKKERFGVNENTDS